MNNRRLQKCSSEMQFSLCLFKFKFMLVSCIIKAEMAEVKLWN